jgi:ribosomal protein S9
LGVHRKYENSANMLFLAGTVTRDPRRVERKKHGRVKARKGQTWVKR